MKKTIFLVITIFCINSAIADSVVDMCSKSDKICACAASQLKQDIGTDDYTLYEAIGADYIANQAKGMDMASAWDAAVKVEATKRGSTSTKILSKTNSIGRTHNKAIKSCSK